MTIDFKDEYVTLRQEMLDRFERIHDTAKYGIGAFVAFLSYYLVHPEFDDFISLLILQLLTALIGLSSLRLYRSIYVVGTYITVVIEHGSEAKWHRMSRQLDDYDKGHKWSHSLPFPVGNRWGADSAQTGILLIALIIVGISSVLYRAGISSAILHSCLLQWILFVFSIGIVFCNVVVVYQMFWGMKKFTKNCTVTWKKYQNDFGKSFKDEYNDC
jgi:hypothetical protein